MPTPAMRPSSDTPRKAVGRNAKNPAISEIAASVSDHPTPRAAARIAEGRSGCSNRSARYRTANWMPKSIPRPTNRAAKATEIGLSSPTMTRPSAAVTIRPEKVVIITATTRAPERNASHRNSRIAPMVTRLLSRASSANVANSSSETATGPVRRRRSPFSEVILRSSAMRRTSFVASAPGCRALKSSTGWIITNLRSSVLCVLPFDSSICHDNRAGLPAIAP